MTEPIELVCPRCGGPANEARFCSTCGLELAAQPQIPTRASWEAQRSETASPVPVPDDNVAAQTTDFPIPDQGGQAAKGSWWNRLGRSRPIAALGGSLAVIAVIVVVVVLTSSGGGGNTGSGSSSTLRSSNASVAAAAITTFDRACANSGLGGGVNTELCACMLNALQAAESPSTLLAQATVWSQGHTTPTEILQASATCSGQ